MLKKSEIKYLNRVAYNVREITEREIGTNDLDGLCKYCSEKIIRILNNIKLNPLLIKGRFALDYPAIDDELLKKLPMEDIYNPVHYWVEIGGYIIDVTADQFNIELDIKNQVDKIIVDKKENLKRHIKSLETFGNLRK